MRSRCRISRALRRRASVRLRPEGWLSSRSSGAFPLVRRSQAVVKQMTMTMTLARACDRAGHVVRILVVLAALATPATAQSGAYKAQRFDVNISPQGGDIVVTEAITFEFQSGTFKRVWREIPT